MPDIYLRNVPSDSNPRDVRLYDPTQADAVGGIVGNASLTSDASILSATGQVLVTGNSTLTNDPSILSANGSVVEGTPIPIQQAGGMFRRRQWGIKEDKKDEMEEAIPILLLELLDEVY